MNLKEFGENALTKATNTFEENKPAIMIFAGVTAIVGAGVCAAVVSYKKRKDITLIKKDIQAISLQKAAIGEPLPEDDTVIFTKKDFWMHYMPKAVARIAKRVVILYGIPFAAAVAGVVSIAMGYAEEHKRYLSASELAATVLAQYAAYRKAVIEEFGQDADDKIMGFDKVEIEEPVLDKDGNPKIGKDGTPKTSKYTKYIVDAEKFGKLSPLAFIWGEYNLDGTVNQFYSPGDALFNENHIKCVEATAGRRVFKCAGKAFMYNDIRTAFDVPKTQYFNLGYHRDDPRMDNSIDLRARKIEYKIPTFGDQIFEGYIIDPNVPGDISGFFDTDPEDYKSNVYETAH